MEELMQNMFESDKPNVSLSMLERSFSEEATENPRKLGMLNYKRSIFVQVIPLELQRLIYL